MKCLYVVQVENYGNCGKLCWITNVNVEGFNLKNPIHFVLGFGLSEGLLKLSFSCIKFFWFCKGPLWMQTCG
jgi:hypothetical protein